MKSEIGKKGMQRLRKQAVRRLVKQDLRGLERIENCIISSGDRIVALSLKLEYNGQVYRANGAARCNMVDEWSEEIGVEIAKGKALFRIGSQIFSTFEKEVKAELRLVGECVFGEVDQWLRTTGRKDITEEEFVSLAREVIKKNGFGDKAPNLAQILENPEG